MMVVILLNAVVIIAMYFPSLRDQAWLEYIDQLFVLIFVIEAVVKLSVYKPKAYFRNSWDRFDFFIVLGSLPTLFMHYLPTTNTSILIILRLFRVIRLVRFIRFVPNLNQVITGLGRALKASVFVLLALCFLNLMFAIFTCHFYQEIAPEYFGDPIKASYSIFQLFTVEGWNEVAAAVASRTSNDLLFGLTRFYFVLIVLIGGIFGMSLANAVFVDEMTMDNNAELEAKIDRLQSELQEIKALLRERS